MNAMVTGGGGFIGSALVGELIKKGFKVTSFSQGDYPGLRKIGVKPIRGNLSDQDSVIKASKNIDIIFHVAAKAGSNGDYSEFYETNVTGTENIINACKINKIPYLIFTSSASVVFDGKDIEGSDESLPYPAHPASYYTATKAMAEKLILNANSDSLKTLSLRPHLVYGPGDNHLLPGIILKAAYGRLRRIGNCRNIVDVSYIDNVVAAHINAAQAILNDPDTGGQAYFISNGEPVLLWDFLDMILQVSGLGPVKKSVPVWIAMVISHLTQTFHEVFYKDQESLITPFIVSELVHSHWFNINKARKYLNYNPVISNSEGLKRLAGQKSNDYSNLIRNDQDL